MTSKGVIGKLGNRLGLGGAAAVGNIKRGASDSASAYRRAIRSAPLTAVGGTGAVMYGAGHLDQSNYQKAKAEKAKAREEAEANKEG